MKVVQVKTLAAIILSVPLTIPLMAHTRATPTAQRANSTNASTHLKATTDPPYVIGPQDVLDVNVWGQSSVSRTVPVRPDGKISLPLLNDVQAAGLTPDQLGAAISRDLRKYIQNPQVTVIVTEINSQHISILGEVNHSGTFSMIPNMTILQALSDAGGFTPFAKLSDIYVLRMVNGHEQKLPFNYKQVLKGNNHHGVLLLKSGDTVIVP